MSATIISIDGQRLDGPPALATADEERRAALHTLGGALKQHGYAFTTVTPVTHARVNARAAAGWAHDLSGIFGFTVFLPVLALGAVHLVLAPRSKILCLAPVPFAVAFYEIPTIAILVGWGALEVLLFAV